MCLIDKNKKLPSLEVLDKAVLGPKRAPLVGYRVKNELGQTLETKSAGKQILMKLPKLSISRFRGTHLDFLRFWNTFKTEVDKTNI